MKRQTNYTKLERAYVRSIIEKYGIKTGLNAKILMRVKSRGKAAKVRITNKTKSRAQNAKDAIQENTVRNIERSRLRELRENTDAYYDYIYSLSSRQKKKAPTLEQYLKNLQTTY